MEPSNDESGSQERTTETRAHRTQRRELVSRRANSESTGVQAIRPRTRTETASPSIRRPDAYEDTDTGTALIQRIPTSVTESEGRNDKVHIACDIATVFCATDDDLTNYVFHCGGAPKNQRGDHESFSKLFNSAPNNGFTNRLKIRASTLRHDNQTFPAPLFTGKSTFLKTPNSIAEDCGRIVVSVRADLCLNINRALNHQRAELNSNSVNAIFKNVSPVALGLC